MFGLVGATIASGRGRNPLGWFLLSTIFPSFILAAMAMPVVPEPAPTPPKSRGRIVLEGFQALAIFFGAMLVLAWLASYLK
jgi:hypothetical protein